MQIKVNQKKCTGCGICPQECPKGGQIWSIDRKTNKAKASNLEFCHLCTICAAKCPTEAIQVIRDDKNAKEKNETKNF